MTTIKGLDAEKCARRNRIMARRGTNSVPVRFLAAGDVVNWGGARSVYGKVPTEPDAIIAAINGKLPEGATALTVDDVYVHYFEAANSNLTRKYWMFLGAKSMRNFVDDATNGPIAFMNSHRTGALSQPSELPFGRTFGGEMQKTADGNRVVMGVYMMRGIYPNGTNGPSTDELHAMISGGTLFDVSYGLPPGGKEICDICGNALNGRDANGRPVCTHSPGTIASMTEPQRKKQADRGVPEGRATFTLDDAHMSELSAVFDGALPGAGVRKVLTMAKAGQLSNADLAEAKTAYAGFLAEGDLSMDPDTVIDLVADGVEEGMRRAKAADTPAPPDDAQMPQDPRIAQLEKEAADARAEANRLRAERETERADQQLKDAQGVLREAASTVDKWIETDHLIFPNVRAEAIVAYAQATANDRGIPVAFALGDMAEATQAIDNHPAGVMFEMGKRSASHAATMRMALVGTRSKDAVRKLLNEGVSTNSRPIDPDNRTPSSAVAAADRVAAQYDGGKQAK